MSKGVRVWGSKPIPNPPQTDPKPIPQSPQISPNGSQSDSKPNPSRPQTYLKPIFSRFQSDPKPTPNGNNKSVSSGDGGVFWKISSLQCTPRAAELVQGFRNAKRRRSGGGDDDRRRKLLEELRVKDSFDSGTKSTASERLQWLRQHKDGELIVLQAKLEAWS